MRTAVHHHLFWAAVILIAFPVLLTSITVRGQNVGISNSGQAPHTSAMLDVYSSSKGLLMPRVSLTGTSDITTVPLSANWLTVFNTATVSDVSPGMYYWDASLIRWVRLMSDQDAWGLFGNSGTVDGTSFLGTVDNIPLSIRVNNLKAGRIDHLSFNSFYGVGAGNLTAAGTDNTFMGWQAGSVNTTGSGNLFLGSLSGSTNVTGSNNTYVGKGSGGTDLNNSTAIGHNALVTASNSMVLGGTGVDAVNVGIGTSAPDPSAKLDIVSSDQGILIPRIALTQTTLAAPVISPETSLLVYNTASVNDVTPGFYYWDGTEWVTFGGTGGGGCKVSIVKTSSTTTASGAAGTTYINDGQLFFPMGANETWIFELVLHNSGTGGVGFNTRFSVPTGATGSYRCARVVWGSPSYSVAMNEYSNITAATSFMSAPLISGVVRNGATPGVFQLQIAARTTGSIAGQSITTNSHLIAHKVGCP